MISFQWNGEDIIINIDGWPIGWHEVCVGVAHISWHVIIIYAYVHVIDLTGPEWYNEIQDQEITVGEPFWYQCTAYDPSGIAGYAVNDTANFQIDSYGCISNTIDLSVGEYWLTISVWDSLGNTREATLKVTVLEGTTINTGTTTGDNTTSSYVMLLAVGGGAVILLVVIVLFMKKRG